MPPPQPPPPPPPAQLARLDVQPAGPIGCYVGDARQLTVTGFDAQRRLIPNVAVAWRSSDPTVLSVSASGLATGLANGQAQATAAAGNIVSPQVAFTVTSGPAEQIAIPFKPSKGALRQEIAARLSQIGDCRIASVRFQLFQAEQEVDLSSLLSGLRGSLSGPGVLTFDLSVTKRGEMSKAQVEQLCEQLPDFRAAQYAARLEVVRTRGQG